MSIYVLKKYELNVYMQIYEINVYIQIYEFNVYIEIHEINVYLYRNIRNKKYTRPWDLEDILSTL